MCIVSCLSWQWHSARQSSQVCHIWLVAWHSGENVGLDRRTFPVARLAFSWWVTTYVDKPSAAGQPTRPAQPFILSVSINEYWAAIRCLPPHLVEAPFGERFRGKGRHGVPCRLNCVILPEHFKVVCIPCKVLYKCSALLCSCFASSTYPFKYYDM